MQMRQTWGMNAVKIFIVSFFLVLFDANKYIMTSSATSEGLSHVQVFHYIIHYWGTLLSDVEICLDVDTNEPKILCEFNNNANIDALSKMYRQAEESRSLDTRTIALYNVHYLHQSLRQNKPQSCKLQTNLTLAESGIQLNIVHFVIFDDDMMEPVHLIFVCMTIIEESTVRYGFLFNASFPNFDGKYLHYIFFMFMILYFYLFV